MCVSASSTGVRPLRGKNCCATLSNKLSFAVSSGLSCFIGASKSQTPEATPRKQDLFLRPVASLSFDDFAANTHGRIRAELEQNGMPIGPLDLQIAAIALTHYLTLVTHNIREFSRIPHLQLEDWETA